MKWKPSCSAGVGDLERFAMEVGDDGFDVERVYVGLEDGRPLSDISTCY